MNRRYLDRLGACALLLPGAEERCAARCGRAGCRLALATNGVARVQRARLAASPLAPYLERLLHLGGAGDAASRSRPFSAPPSPPWARRTSEPLRHGGGRPGLRCEGEPWPPAWTSSGSPPAAPAAPAALPPTYIPPAPWRRSGRIIGPTPGNT